MNRLGSDARCSDVLKVESKTRRELLERGRLIHADIVAFRASNARDLYAAWRVEW
jgi:hypothetical protein